MSLLPTHKESVNSDELCVAKDESDGESGNEEYEEELDSEEDENDIDFIFFQRFWREELPFTDNSVHIRWPNICEVVVQGS